MKILIFGLPGSGKSTLAKPFADLIGGVHLNADDVRKEYNDWDFTPEGRNRQASRMRYLADGVVRAGKVAVADFVCPTEHARKEFNPDYTVWMDIIHANPTQFRTLLKPNSARFGGTRRISPKIHCWSIQTVICERGREGDV
jgi:hypothetical protein